MKKLLLIALLIMGCNSCTNDKVDTDDKSKSDKMFKLIKDVATDKYLGGKSKIDCQQKCEETFDLFGWHRKEENEGIDTLFIQCVEGCELSQNSN